MADELRKKLVILAERVQKRKLTTHEVDQIEEKVEQLHLANEGLIKQALAEALSKTSQDVITNLSAYDDSDRLIDDIVDTLNDDD